MKKSLASILLLVFLISSPSSTMALEKFIVEPKSASSIFVTYSSGIGNSSQYIICSASSNLTGVYYQSITMELEKFTNGTWQRVTSWYYAETSFTMDMRHNYPKSPGLYRVKSTHVAGGETRISYSGNLQI